MKKYTTFDDVTTALSEISLKKEDEELQILTESIDQVTNVNDACLLIKILFDEKRIPRETVQNYAHKIIQNTTTIDELTIIWSHLGDAGSRFFNTYKLEAEIYKRENEIVTKIINQLNETKDLDYAIKVYKNLRFPESESLILNKAKELVKNFSEAQQILNACTEKHQFYDQENGILKFCVSNIRTIFDLKYCKKFERVCTRDIVLDMEAKEKEIVTQLLPTLTDFSDAILCSTITETVVNKLLLLDKAEELSTNFFELLKTFDYKRSNLTPLQQEPIIKKLISISTSTIQTTYIKYHFDSLVSHLNLTEIIEQKELEILAKQ